MVLRRRQEAEQFSPGLLGSVDRTTELHRTQLHPEAARMRNALAPAPVGAEQGEDQSAQARVNSGSISIPAIYASNIRDSPGMRRVRTVYSPCTKRVREEMRGHAVNVTSATYSDSYAIHVRPPPEQHQSAASVVPVAGGIGSPTGYFCAPARTVSK